MERVRVPRKTPSFPTPVGAPPRAGLVSQVQTLQRTIGNRATTRLLQRGRHGKESKHDRRRGRQEKLEGVERSIPPEVEHHLKGYRVRYESASTDPYSSEEVEKFLTDHQPGDLFKIDPRRIRTMHAGISERFSDDTLIADTVETLTADRNAIRNVPAVTVRAIDLRVEPWEREEDTDLDGNRELCLFAEDHRRVVAARLSGISQMDAQFVSARIARGKYTTGNRGMSVEVRSYADIKEGRHQGTNRPTLPSSARAYEWRAEEETD